MSDLGAVIDVIVNNRADLEDAVTKLGGLDAFIRAAPDLFRIWKVVASHGSTPAPEQVQRVLAYSQETADSVRRYQERHGLTADGIVGNETWGDIVKRLGEDKP